MTKLELIFTDILRMNPNYSTYIAFANTVIKTKLDPERIKAYFEEWVDRRDYRKSDKDQILAHLYSLGTGVA